MIALLCQSVQPHPHMAQLAAQRRRFGLQLLACVYVCVSVYVHMHVCIRACVGVCVCMCLCVSLCE